MTLQKYLKQNWKNFALGILAVLLILTLIGSTLTNNMMSKSSSNSELAYDYGRQTSSSYYGYDDGFAPDVEERKIIKNANINLETKNYDYTKTQISNTLDQNNAIILRENENTYRDVKTTTYSIKIESDKLETTLKTLKTFGEVNSFNIYSNDVTGSYVNYEKRLNRYQEQITKYEALLKKDIEIEEEIKVQNRIDDLEDQIFYLQSRMENIDEDVQYSEIYMTLNEKPNVFKSVDFTNFEEGFKLFLESLNAALKFVIIAFGFLLPFGIIYLVYRLLKRK